MTDVHNDMLVDEDFDTILSPDIDFTGTLNFEKSFFVRGRLTGEINAHGVLLIDEDAVVEADIRADRIIIRGSVKGDITATDKVEVTATGKLDGNVRARQVNMEAGCHFNGKCTMLSDASVI